MAFRISRRALQLAIAQAIAIAAANLRRATARQQWRDSITGTVTVRIRDAAGTLKATVTRPQAQAGDWATLEADSAVFAWAGTTSTVASAGNPPSAAPWWTMHFEDASGEFAVMTVGSRASSGADYKLDPLKVGAPVRLRNLVFATNPALTGGGSGAAPGFITTFRAKPVSGTAVSGARFTTGISLGPTDLPVGTSIEVRRSDGTVVPSQQDQDADAWADGASSYVAVTCVADLTGGEDTFHVYRKSGAPSQAPWTTLTAFLATNTVEMEYIGQPAGPAGVALPAGTYKVSANEIAAGGALWNDSTGWGANPLRGYEIVKSGPHVMEWRLWSYLRRTDGEYHGWVQGVIHLQAFATGGMRLLVRTSHVGMTGKHPSASLGSANAWFVDYTAKLRVNGQVIREFGGVNDPRHIVLAQSTAVDVAGNLINTGASAIDTGEPCRFASDGTLPGGIEANRTYFARWTATGKRQFYIDRESAFFGSDAAKRLTITSTGTGNLSLIPVVANYWRNSWVSCGASGEFDWIGTTQGEILCGQDFAHLTQKARMTPSYDPATVVTPVGSAQSYRPNQRCWQIPENLGGTGDGQTDERIGYLNRGEVRGLYLPLSKFDRQHTRRIALWNLDFRINYHNEATGRQPNFRAEAHPTLGSSFVNWRAGYGNPSFGWDMDGQANGYAPQFEASHDPCHWAGQYLLTGDIVWREIGEMKVGAHYASFPKAYTQHGAALTSVYAALDPYSGDQIRGIGWAARTLNLVTRMMPKTHPARQYYRDVADTMIAQWDAYRSSPVIGPTQVFSTFGPAKLGAPHEVANYMQNFFAISLGMFCWQGHAGAKAYWSNHLKKWYEQFDADITDARGTGNLSLAGVRNTNMGSGSPITWATTWAQAWANTGHPTSDPGTGFTIGGDSGTGPISYLFGTRAAMALMANAGDALALKLFNRIGPRWHTAYSAENGGRNVSTVFNEHPRYNIIAVGA